MPYLPDLSLEEALMDIGNALVFTSDRESNVRLFRDLMRRRCQQIAKKASVKIKTEAGVDACSDKQASSEDADVREKSPQPKKRFKIESSSSLGERSKENLPDTNTNTSDLLRAASVYRNQDDDDELEVVSSWRPTARGSKAMSLTQDKHLPQIAQQQSKNASSSTPAAHLTEASSSSSKPVTVKSFTSLMQDTKINKSKSLELLCSICGTQSIDPCAGRCGHVCCSACWVPWLRINKTCPICRKECTHETVSRLRLKSS